MRDCVIWPLKVDDVEAYLARLDQLGIENTGLPYDDFDGKKMAFSSIQKDCPWKYMSEESNG